MRNSDITYRLGIMLAVNEMILSHPALQREEAKNFKLDLCRENQSFRRQMQEA